MCYHVKELLVRLRNSSVKTLVLYILFYYNDTTGETLDGKNLEKKSKINLPSIIVECAYVRMTTLERFKRMGYPLCRKIKKALCF